MACFLTQVKEEYIHTRPLHLNTHGSGAINTAIVAAAMIASGTRFMAVVFRPDNGKYHYKYGSDIL